VVEYLFAGSTIGSGIPHGFSLCFSILEVTGRSKEVINRGGEIISPMEVEDAIMGHPDVLACAAFSAPHDVLQEVVGLVLVMKDKRPRLDLPALHEFLKDRLAAPKWPQCLVFMDGLPKSNTNKLLRVKLGERLRIPKLTEKMKPMERTFEAKCPPQGTALTVPIRISSIKIAVKRIGNQLRIHCKTSPASQLFVTRDSKHSGALICYLYNIDRNQAIETAMEVLDRYAVPTYFVCLKNPVQKPVDLQPPKMTDAVAFILQGGTTGSDDPVVQKIQKLFAETLNLDYPPGIDANFFLLGGSSMLASQLASQIRKRFSVPINGSEVFQFTSPGELAKLIRDRGGALSNQGLNGELLETGEGIEFVQNEKKQAPASVLRREKADDGVELSTYPPEGLLAHDHLAPKGSFFASIFQFVPSKYTSIFDPSFCYSECSFNQLLQCSLYIPYGRSHAIFCSFPSF
jgi:acyl carrier protein